jgi:hypothetical protein
LQVVDKISQSEDLLDIPIPSSGALDPRHAANEYFAQDNAVLVVTSLEGFPHRIDARNCDMGLPLVAGPTRSPAGVGKARTAMEEVWDDVEACDFVLFDSTSEAKLLEEFSTVEGRISPDMLVINKLH